MYLMTSVYRETPINEHFNPNIDDRYLQTWHFTLIDTVLVLNVYTLSIKEPGKRKYNIVKHYDRIMTRENNMTMDEVPFPEDVQVEAKNDIFRQIHVSKKLN